MGNNADTYPKLINCVFSGNSAETDSGALQVRTSFTLTNCTIAGNVAGVCGGGFKVELGNPTLTNCVVWGNSAPSGAQIAGSASISFSCVEGDWNGEGNIDLDPLFVNASGLDGILGTADDDMRLGSGSPCIDAGTNLVDTDPSTPGNQPLPETDLDGHPRFVDDPWTPDTGGGTPPVVDMGAYEFFLDCNNNAAPDDRDVSAGTSLDCNTNGIPDECELEDNDCNTNGVPDDCEPDFDGDGLIDDRDDDIDGDKVPNEQDVCDFTPLGAAVDAEGRPLGDFDGDCDVDLQDFAKFQHNAGLCVPRRA